jgi:hypothetical protein
VLFIPTVTVLVAHRLQPECWDTEEEPVAKEDRDLHRWTGKQRDIASKGGKAAHQKGHGYEWTSGGQRSERWNGESSTGRNSSNSRRRWRLMTDGNTPNRRLGDWHPVILGTDNLP